MNEVLKSDDCVLAVLQEVDVDSFIKLESIFRKVITNHQAGNNVNNNEDDKWCFFLEFVAFVLFVFRLYWVYSIVEYLMLYVFNSYFCALLI